MLAEEVLYLCCDFSAKVLFSSTLMLSSFKEFEARRENAMRVIESSSKANLITELQVSGVCWPRGVGVVEARGAGVRQGTRGSLPFGCLKVAAFTPPATLPVILLSSLRFALFLCPPPNVFLPVPLITHSCSFRPLSLFSHRLAQPLPTLHMPCRRSWSRRSAS